MDAAHRAALLTASCLHTPVNPRTRAPVALYEREPGRLMARGGGGERQDSLNSEREENSAVRDDCEDWIDLSKMYLSNQEYYLKLEELKNAHLETMAKLENMYRNKLYLKDVQPITNVDNCSMSYRSTWEKSSFHPQNIRKSFSEPELNNSFHSNSSDVSDQELELENVSEGGGSLIGKEQIDNVWDELSLENYSHRTKSIASKLQSLKKSKRKKKNWSPMVTVPEPFQMTIREAKKKKQNIKSKSLIELENSFLKKQLEEEAECQKKFRANPVPAYVFVPLYHEIMQQNEERRKSIRERRREILLASQKPFQFIEREAQKKEMRKMQLRDLSEPEKKKVFKAKPVPKFVYSSEVNEKLKEEELYREIRIRVRSEELLRNSSLPNSRLGNRGADKHRQQDCLEQSEELEHKPRTKLKIPDFEKLHQKFQKQLQKQKNVKNITVCEPFKLHTRTIPSKKERILEDIQMDEERLKETRWPYASSRCKPEMRSLNTNSYPLGCEESTFPKITKSTRRRLKALRDSAEEKRKLEDEQNRNRTKQKERVRKLQRLITTRAEANDPHLSLAQMYKSKLKVFRKHEKQRMKEYLQELEEMEERVEKRPLLLERATQKNARIAAEKHYSDTLRELGLCEEFVSKKGQTATEMLLRDDENKVDARESRGEEKSGLQSEDEDEDEKEAVVAAVAEAQSYHDDQDALDYENENYEEDSEEKSTDDEG
ncbi:protein FAM161A isoform X2 [Hemicordylus capensis]|uniref:protein FAM161A isoform X2 n=1 Tax=Hemicordylus capensis TaxID=884348 RepID=UPI002303D84B|nr:protein FAM161A isoform X2 [Hemicordylus capensis]